jgi:hypothetical protein
VTTPKPPSRSETIGRAFAEIRPPHRREEPTPPAPRVKLARRPEPPLRPVDLLKRTWPGRGERGFTVGQVRDDPAEPAALAPFVDAGTAPNLRAPKSFYRAPVPGPRGAAEILGELNRRGITVQLTADQSRIYIETPGGRIDDPTIDAIARSARLLVAALRGEPLTCELAHDGPPPLAVTLLAGGDAASCDEHAG